MTKNGLLAYQVSVHGEKKLVDLAYSETGKECIAFESKLAAIEQVYQRRYEKPPLTHQQVLPRSE